MRAILKHSSASSASSNAYQLEGKFNIAVSDYVSMFIFRRNPLSYEWRRLAFSAQSFFPFLKRTMVLGFKHPSNSLFKSILAALFLGNSIIFLIAHAWRDNSFLTHGMTIIIAELSCVFFILLGLETDLCFNVLLKRKELNDFVALNADLLPTHHALSRALVVSFEYFLVSVSKELTLEEWQEAKHFAAGFLDDYIPFMTVVKMYQLAAFDAKKDSLS